MMTSQKSRSRHTRVYPYSVELRYFEEINGTVYERIHRVDHISPKRKIKHSCSRVAVQGMDLTANLQHTALST